MGRTYLLRIEGRNSWVRKYLVKMLSYYQTPKETSSLTPPVNGNLYRVYLPGNGNIVEYLKRKKTRLRIEVIPDQAMDAVA